ncbi:hypothetical protein NQ317_008164 [Molorchus minor]|uniref:von Hippel-Lindau disease tumour suppressor beta domain-containing protein n=1 Tax=Molorchus minor TaxID=1323400 RepID=A0ABQ9JID6_9CUCU|nr:hypothetical protein NQ317_008164 [Molorchus minor]
MPSRDRAYVRFFNKTNKTVEIIWLNFHGEKVRYKIIEKDDYVDVNTYKNHPWIALDVETKDRFQIDSKYVFMPKTTREYLQDRFPGREIPEEFERGRVGVYVTVPVYSLKYRAMLEVRNHLQEPEFVDQLELPKSLAEELRKTIEHRNSQIQLYIQTYESDL